MPLKTRVTFDRFESTSVPEELVEYLNELAQKLNTMKLEFQRTAKEQAGSVVVLSPAGTAGVVGEMDFPFRTGIKIPVSPNGTRITFTTPIGGDYDVFVSCYKLVQVDNKTIREGVGVDIMDLDAGGFTAKPMEDAYLTYHAVRRT